MSRAGKFVVVASAVWLAAAETIAAHRTTGLVFLGLLISLGFLAVTVLGFVRAITEWRQRRWRAVLPLAACVFALLIFMPLGRLITHAVFDWSLPSYEAVVRRVESGSIPSSAEASDITYAAREARLTYRVIAQKGPMEL